MIWRLGSFSTTNGSQIQPKLAITAPDLFQILLPTLQTHKSISLGNIDYESTTDLATASPSAPVTFILSQFAIGLRAIFAFRRGATMEHIPNEYVTEERHCRNQKGRKTMGVNISTDS
jgi:hypothetical protein